MDLTTQKLLATSSFGINGCFAQPFLPFTRLSCALPVCRKASVAVNAKKRDTNAQPLAKKTQQSQIEEDGEDQEEDEGEYDYEDEFDSEFEDEFDDENGDEEEESDEETSNYLDEDILLDDEIDEEDETELNQEDIYFGDGEEGGGISLGTNIWEKEALSIAEQVSQNSFNGDLKIYAFKTSPSFQIYVRIEKLSEKYGSPNIGDIESFSREYRKKLDEAESDGKIPANTYLEVSSPGCERALKIPEDFERFKDRVMYVKYVSNDLKENEGILRLVSYDSDLGNCIWALADVKANKPGKGRPLNKKQKEWRLNTDFESLKLVRLYLDL